MGQITPPPQFQLRARVQRSNLPGSHSLMVDVHMFVVRTIHYMTATIHWVIIVGHINIWTFNLLFADVVIQSANADDQPECDCYKTEC